MGFFGEQLLCGSVYVHLQYRLGPTVTHGQNYILSGKHQHVVTLICITAIIQNPVCAYHICVYFFICQYVYPSVYMSVFV